MGLKMSKNQSLPAVSDFRRDFPQFADPAKYPDAQIGFRLNLADELLSENVTGKKLFPYFAGLFVAHYMTLWGLTAERCWLVVRAVQPMVFSPQSPWIR
ncbi:Uncharacterised protein [Escherichia coli]|nr:Uncharacterised protein [Escherichia coli]